MDLRISLIAPVFQGADVIDEFHRQVTAVLEQLGVQFEILFVDDASPDRSWEVICAAGSTCVWDPARPQRPPD